MRCRRLIGCDNFHKLNKRNASSPWTHFFWTLFACIQGNPDTDALARTVPALGASPRSSRMCRASFMRDRVIHRTRQIFQKGAGLGSHDEPPSSAAVADPRSSCAVKRQHRFLQIKYPTYEYLWLKAKNQENWPHRPNGTCYLYV
jgi:hypothetical protein